VLPRADTRERFPAIRQPLSAREADFEGLILNRHDAADASMMAGKEPTEHAHKPTHRCYRLRKFALGWVARRTRGSTNRCLRRHEAQLGNGRSAWHHTLL